MPKKAPAKPKQIETNPQEKAFLLDDFVKKVMSDKDDCWRGEVIEGEASKQNIEMDKWLIIEVAELLKNKNVTMLLRKLVEITLEAFPTRREPSWDHLLIDGGLITKEEYTMLEEKFFRQILEGLTSHELKALYKECELSLPEMFKLE